MVVEIDGGTLAVFAALVGLKMAVFIGVLSLSILTISISKNKNGLLQWGLTIMSGSFMLVAFLELFRIMNLVDEFLPILGNQDLMEIILESLFIIAGLGLLAYLKGFKEEE